MHVSNMQYVKLETISTDDSENSCCLLHLDSLSLHSTNAVLTNVATFLSEEFARRAALTPATENSPSTPQSTDRKLGGQGRVFNRTNCPFVKCKQVNIHRLLAC